MRMAVELIMSIFKGNSVVVIKTGENSFKVVKGKQINNKFMKNSFISILKLDYVLK